MGKKNRMKKENHIMKNTQRRTISARYNIAEDVKFEYAAVKRLRAYDNQRVILATDEFVCI